MASMQKRLQKELMALQSDPPPGMKLNEKSVQNTITEWFIDMEGASGTLYEGEKFQLLFKFSSRYPFDSPQMIHASIRVHHCVTVVDRLLKYIKYFIEVVGLELNQQTVANVCGLGMLTGKDA
ncbi:putative ubiquitin-conjugating enzyme E2 W-B [Triplophysa tibetana]|uniref:Putative ubiquitin-conjugating enzyme E2 W-B n=1 Tax=Triplophysa tibetana TaxID=1572043 RepID=A0A5A9PA13_9TELE|nr:putative ubiquitin-conjugating enzyme E2 W-B [Triplophysa tibetana]